MNISISCQWNQLLGLQRDTPRLGIPSLLPPYYTEIVALVFLHRSYVDIQWISTVCPLSSQSSTSFSWSKSLSIYSYLHFEILILSHQSINEGCGADPPRQLPPDKPPKSVTMGTPIYLSSFLQQMLRSYPQTFIFVAFLWIILWVTYSGHESLLLKTNVISKGKSQGCLSFWSLHQQQQSGCSNQKRCFAFIVFSPPVPL